MKHSRKLSVIASAAIVSLVNGAPAEIQDDEKHTLIQLKLNPGQVVTVDESQDVPIFSFTQVKSGSEAEAKPEIDAADCKSYMIDMSSSFEDADNIDIPTTTYDPYDEQYYPSHLYGSAEAEVVLPPTIAADAFKKPEESVVLNVFAPNAGWHAPLIPSGSFVDLLSSTRAPQAGAGIPVPSRISHGNVQAVVSAKASAEPMSDTPSDDTRMRAARLFGIPPDTSASRDENSTLVKRNSLTVKRYDGDLEKTDAKQHSLEKTSTSNSNSVTEVVKKREKGRLGKRRLLSEVDSSHCPVGFIYSIIDDDCLPSESAEAYLDDHQDTDTFTFHSTDGNGFRDEHSASQSINERFAKLIQLSSPTRKDDDADSNSGGYTPSVSADKLNPDRFDDQSDNPIYGPQTRLEKRMKHGSNAFNASMIGNGAGMKTHGHTIHDNSNGVASSPSIPSTMYATMLLAALLGIWSTSIY